MALVNLAILRQPQVWGPESGLHGGMDSRGVGLGSLGQKVQGLSLAGIAQLF